jgi:hypothetical protein
MVHKALPKAQILADPSIRPGMPVLSVGVVTLCGMDSELPFPLRNLARQQEGVVSRSQALRAGLSADMIKFRVRSGWWRPVHRGTKVEETVLDLAPAAATFDEVCGWVTRAFARDLTDGARLRAAMGRRTRLRWRAGAGPDGLRYPEPARSGRSSRRSARSGRILP